MTDVIVIGGGPGGTAAAIRTAQLGAQVTLVERTELGGNCVNRNCIPANILMASVELLAKIRRAEEFGIQVGPASLDLARVQQRRETILAELREGMAGLLASYGVEVIAGNARLRGPKEVEVSLRGPGGAAGRRLSARAIVIATGARVLPPPFPVDGAVTAVEALALEHVPERLLVVGGDGVQLEVATLFAILGSRVTLVTGESSLLPLEDYEVGQRLQGTLQGQGVEILAGATLRGLRREPRELIATVAGSSGETQVPTDLAVWAEREPATADLGLAEAGVRLSGKAIAVNNRLETNVPGIYAVGDVTGQWLLSAVATAQGIVAAENALGKQREIDYRAVPRCYHTLPEVACVGLTELQAEDEGYEVEISNIPFAINARAMALGEVEGSVKIVADAKYKKILGVHIVGYRAQELIADAALAIQLEATAEDLANAIRFHPTFGESQVEAARALLGQAVYLPKF